MLRSRRFVRLCALLLAALFAAPGAVASAQADDARYALANGCFALRSEARGAFVSKAPGGYAASTTDPGSAEAFRMQASDLGTYLLFGKGADFAGTTGQSRAIVAGEPGPSTDFKVDGPASGFTISAVADGRVLSAGPGDGALTLTPPGTQGASTRFTFVPAQGCAIFPEAETNTTGTPATGATSFGEVKGYLDSIVHLMAFEFIGGSIRCGRPWSPYGITKAMVDCPDHEPMGAGAAVENALSYGNPAHLHDTVGWPTFRDWPSAPSLTHEQVYYKWLERSWRAGQRLIVDVAVDNAQLCELYPLNRNGCDEMSTSRLEIADSYKLQDYIDAQSGGPGKGWFRIVKDPFEARRVINQGKLAVVLGMETSRLFGCRLLDDVPQCDRAQINREFEDFYKRGVRSLQLVNKFDNGLVGVAGDGGSTGVVVNSGNRRETGRYWELETCSGPTGDNGSGQDKEQTTALPDGDEAAFARGLGALAPSGTAPLYPPAPHCNKRGLTSLGEYLVNKMMDRKMIVDPDHMSVLGRDQTLTLLEARGYSGVLSTHGWSTPDSFGRIYALGGLVTPYAGGSTSFVKEWQQDRKLASPKYPFGLGFGSDISGFGSQGGPRGADAPNKVTYPFTSLDGAVKLDRPHTGKRTWDINTDGVAQYGLYPDWIEDLRKLGGDAIVNDLARGAETYVAMWERAEGVAAQRCQPARTRVTRAGLGRVHLGDEPEALLRRAGQPVRRPGRPWEYCVQGPRDGRRAGGRIAPVFTQEGRVAFVGSTGPEHTVKGVATGDRPARLPRGTRSVGHGLRALAAGGGARYVFGVRRGRVSFVGVAAQSVASRSSLRSYLRLAGLR